jgi:hypothetical protein
VDILASVVLVGHAMDKPGIRVEVEDDWRDLGEECPPLGLVQPVRVLSLVHEFEEVDNVDTADLEAGEVVEEQVDGGQGLVSGHVAAASHDNIGLLILVCAELGPDTDALGTVLDRLLHGQILQMNLLVGHDHVDVVVRSKTVVHYCLLLENCCAAW